MERWAVIDDAEQYRYTLTRIWGLHGLRVLFCMLNPSKADGYTDDPTIRKCISFSRWWGYGSLEVVNLYAFRATDPKDLRKAAFPVGPENDHYIRTAATRAHLIVAAWGNNAPDQVRVDAVCRLLVDARCLGKTQKGAPRHPLYLPANTRLSCYCLAGEQYREEQFQ